MPEYENEPIDVLLKDFFSEKLEGQRGRSERSFRRYLENASRAAWRQRVWLIGTFVTGMAASVAALWAAPLFRALSPSHPGEANLMPTPEQQNIPAAVERVVNAQTIDEGVMMLDDNTPVRVLRRRGVEETRWLAGPDKVVRQQVTPRDDLLFIEVHTN